MAIGERIHFFRTLRGMTQKYLGMALGFPEKSADVRLAQYENCLLYTSTNIRHFANIAINDALGSVNFAILIQITVNDHIRRN